MKKHYYTWICLVVILIAAITPGQGQTTKKSIAILPFATNGIDEITAQTAGALLRLELSKLTVLEIIPETRTTELTGGNACFDLSCALEFAAQAQAGLVIMVRLDALGDKVIVTYQLVDVNAQKSIFMDKTTSATIEDLETVMQRVANSIVNREPIEKGAKIGVVMENESKDFYHRGSNKYGGFAFGYLYPQNGYDDVENAFTMEFRTGSEMPDYNVGMLLAFRKGFAMNIYSNYLFSRKDICPYLGGAFGFHWVSHDHGKIYYDSYGYEYEKEQKNDGFELTVNSGMILMRTYDVQILVNLAFTHTFNDYKDQGVVFTIGLLK